jgi:hypothetical protein
VCGVTAGENELNALEVVHRYVESLDVHFGNVGLSSFNAAWPFLADPDRVSFSRSPNLTCEHAGVSLLSQKFW